MLQSLNYLMALNCLLPQGICKGRCLLSLPRQRLLCKLWGLVSPRTERHLALPGRGVSLCCFPLSPGMPHPAWVSENICVGPAHTDKTRLSCRKYTKCREYCHASLSVSFECVWGDNTGIVCWNCMKKLNKGLY